MRVICAPSATDVVYCGIAVDAGTRDELPDENGLAHFCEHLTFKGTHRRRSWHILNRMESVGGDLNAYTGKEETIYYTAFLKEHFARAVDLLADIVLGSTYPQTEMNKEVEVVIDEIESYNDSPSELIFDDFENLIFCGHPWDVTSWAKPDVCGDSAARTSNVSPGGCTVPTGWFSSSTDASNRHTPAGKSPKP